MPPAPIEEVPIEESPTQPAAPTPSQPEPEHEPEPAPASSRESVAKSVADMFRRSTADEPTRVGEPVAVGGAWASRTGASDDTETTEGPQGHPGERPAKKGLRQPAVTVPTVGEGGLTARLVAGVVGALAGLLMVGGTIAVMGGCEVVRGTATCGGGPGFFLIVALVAVTVIAGAGGLRLTGVPYAGLISFLGVGMVVVLVLLFLLAVIYSLLMVVVSPLLASASFVLAHAVSTNVGEWSGPEWR